MQRWVQQLVFYKYAIYLSAVEWFHEELASIKLNKFLFSLEQKVSLSLNLKNYIGLFWFCPQKSSHHFRHFRHHSRILLASLQSLFHNFGNQVPGFWHVVQSSFFWELVLISVFWVVVQLSSLFCIQDRFAFQISSQFLDELHTGSFCFSVRFRFPVFRSEFGSHYFEEIDKSESWLDLVRFRGKVEVDLKWNLNLNKKQK